jgi:hypothetical protein
MPSCPKCGRKVKHGEFCPDCGIHLESSIKSPKIFISHPVEPKSSGSNILFIGAGAFLVLLVLLGVFFIISPETNVPTKIQMTAPNKITVNSSTNLKINLVNYQNKPVANKTVIVSNGEISKVITNALGEAETNLLFNSTGIHKLKITFPGDSTYQNTTFEEEVTVTPPSCNDSTFVGECSKSKGYFCNEDLTLKFKCSVCGCPNELICYDNYCFTPEQKIPYMIEKLQKGVVYVAHDYATGSGVIIAHAEDYTFILTNRHVIKDADSASTVKITTRDGQTVPVQSILVAPYDVDLALLIVLGTYGTPIEVNSSEKFYQGEEVMALGSPLGIQGSVSNGIISNFVTSTSETGYNYISIQTDAAINPGNSGGGLFLKKNGHLVGINSFILTSDYGAEGLGFAIDIRSIDKLPSPEHWDTFTPTPRCSDGTPYGSCSVKNIGKFCSTKGYLNNDCMTCGCTAGAYCLATGKCFSCSSGYKAWSVWNGEGYCCPNGWTFWDDRANEQFCCPPGTVGYVGGYCE